MKLGDMCVEFTEWAKWKAIIDDPSFTSRIHYSDKGTFYNVFAYDGYCYEVNIPKPSADATDFENNYKAGAFEVN